MKMKKNILLYDKLSLLIESLINNFQGIFRRKILNIYKTFILLFIFLLLISCNKTSKDQDITSNKIEKIRVLYDIIK